MMFNIFQKIVTVLLNPRGQDIRPYLSYTIKSNRKNRESPQTYPISKTIDYTAVSLLLPVVLKMLKIEEFLPHSPRYCFHPWWAGGGKKFVRAVSQKP